MLHHRRKDLRNRAYKALTDKWDDAFTSDLWRNVEQHGDRHAAALLAQHETEERVWRDFDLLKATGGAWVARLILSRVLEAGMQVNLDAVEDDPITRTYLAAKFHLPIDLRRVEQSMDHLLEDDRAGLLIWSLGKLKAWDLVLLADKLWPGAQDRALRRWITPLEETT
ncbi:MAG: hypothetical protein JWP49_1253 [Phenylobacterium sp.]|nr:hypothetical protein [Phenylobacterium sp.]